MCLLRYYFTFLFHFLDSNFIFLSNNPLIGLWFEFIRTFFINLMYFRCEIGESRNFIATMIH